MDGQTFQGRLLHVLPAEAKKEDKLDEIAISKLPLKQQQKIKRKLESANATHKWNPLYMNMDDVMSSISARMGVPKSELLDATSGDAAVKQALAETHLIQEAKGFFAQHGVDLDSFKPGRQRGDTAILVKNFPHGTTMEEIRQLFEPHGQIVRLISPPSGTMALVEFAQATQGRVAFAALKYQRIKNSILFLEKAPKDVFATPAQLLPAPTTKTDITGKTKLNARDLLEEPERIETMETSTLFVRNLNFTTSTDKLKDIFKSLTGFVSAKVKTRPDPKNSNQTLSMGFGFVEFRNKDDASAALGAMNNYVLEGHKLEVRPSQKTLDAGEERRKEDRAKAAQGTKVVVKNLPFEASKGDVRSLLGAYGRLRSVRLPKKFDAKSRGFAFAEFTTSREATAAMEALRDTHLLGRRLHIEYAEEEAMDAEEEIERMQKKVGAQVDKVAIQKLTDNTRHKFRVDGNDEPDDL
jgi:multiple RNA-binding domain-containing protein 1